MSEPPDLPQNIPNTLRGCRAFIQEQTAAVAQHAATISEQAGTIAAQGRTIEELGVEVEKLRKLLSHFVNGHRSERRILTGPDQDWLPFDNHEEFQAARAEAEGLLRKRCMCQ